MNFRYHFIHATTLLAVAFCLTACLPEDLIGILDDDDTTEEPTNPSNPTDKNAVTVTPEGSKVTRGDISINFPRGTFDQDVKVTVDDATASNVTASPARSKFYKVSLPAVGTKKDITMTLKCDGTPGDAMMIVQQKGWNRHTGETQDQLIDIPSTASGDARVATIDNFEATDGEQITFTVGLIDDVAPTRSETRTYTTRAGAKYAFTVTYDLGFNVKSKEWWQSFLGTFYAKKDDMVKAVQDYLPTVFEKLNDNGYDMIPVTDTLKYYITTSSDDTWGGYVNSMLKTTWGVVNLNVERVFNYMNHEALKATLMHETLHAIYDRVYDKRYAWKKCAEGLSGDPWAMLDEAVGSWSEKLSEQEVINKEVTPKYAPGFMQTFVPVERSYMNCRNHGYGMALFIEYLSQKTSNKDISKLFEYRRSAGQKSYDMYEALQQFFNEKGVKFAVTKDYMDFAIEALTGKISNVFNIHDESFGKDGVALETFQVTQDNAVFGMGADIIRYKFKCTAPADIEKLDTCEMIVAQNVEGLVTYVYGLKRKKLTQWMGYEMTLLGSSTSTEPCRISGKAIRDEYAGDLAFITVKEVSNYLSVTSTMKQKGVKQDLLITFEDISVTPKELTYSGGGGTQKVKVNYGTYKHYGFKINEADQSWLLGEVISGASVLFTAMPNTSASPRSTTVYCFVTNVENSTDAQRVYLPVKVTQKAGSSGDFEYAVGVINFACTAVCDEHSTYTDRYGTHNEQRTENVEFTFNYTLFDENEHSVSASIEEDNTVHVDAQFSETTRGVTSDIMDSGRPYTSVVNASLSFDIKNFTGDYSTSSASNISFSKHGNTNYDDGTSASFTQSLSVSNIPFDWSYSPTKDNPRLYFNGKPSISSASGSGKGHNYSYTDSYIGGSNDMGSLEVRFYKPSSSSAPRRIPLRATPGCASEEAPTAP